MYVNLVTQQKTFMLMGNNAKNVIQIVKLAMEEIKRIVLIVYMKDISLTQIMFVNNAIQIVHNAME